jgi:predicted signal transduction protein with EAL and GGDEF domain
VAFADHLARALATPAVIDGDLIDIDASIGVVMFPEHGRDSSTLLRHAEVALFQAKQRVTPTAAIYMAEEDETAAMRWSLLTDLRRALQTPERRDELSFAYQPQVSLATDEHVGMEALLRWHHPERGPVDVADIFLAAEHSPIMAQLTNRVVEDVVAQLSTWNASGLRQRASINVSPRDLERSELIESITTALAVHDVAASQLTVEVTETALMAELHEAQSTLHSLSELGIAISLDDFGTGYSSMAHLRRLPVSEVKIDRSFTSRIAEDPEDHAIVRSIIDLGHDLGLRVVAEGVEDEQTQRLLAQAGCDIAQGWLVARPMPSHQVPAWLEDRGQAQRSALTPAAHLADEASPP